jgi:hypothetical protein
VKRIANEKLNEIKMTRAINWRRFAGEAKVNYNQLMMCLNNQRICTHNFADKLIETFLHYGIKVTAKELIGEYKTLK